MNDSVSGPIPIMEDNQSTIIQITKDHSNPHIRQLDIVLTWLHYQYIRYRFLPFYIDTAVIFILLPLFLCLGSRDTEIEYSFRSLIPSTRSISTDDISALTGLLSNGSNSILSRRDTMRQQGTRRDSNQRPFRNG